MEFRQLFDTLTMRLFVVARGFKVRGNGPQRIREPEKWVDTNIQEARSAPLRIVPCSSSSDDYFVRRL
jgi:hypothetical protein